MKWRKNSQGRHEEAGENVCSKVHLLEGSAQGEWEIMQKDHNRLLYSGQHTCPILCPRLPFAVAAVSLQGLGSLW